MVVYISIWEFSLKGPTTAHLRGHSLTAVVTHGTTKAAGACFLVQDSPTASALEIGNHIAGYTDYYAIRV